MKKSYEELVKELMLHVTCCHLDMGGKHKYSLTSKAHEVIQEIKYKMWEESKNG
jgi:hypothetical protein